MHRCCKGPSTTLHSGCVPPSMQRIAALKIQHNYAQQLWVQASPAVANVPAWQRISALRVGLSMAAPCCNVDSGLAAANRLTLGLNMPSALTSRFALTCNDVSVHDSAEAVCHHDGRPTAGSHQSIQSLQRSRDCSQSHQTAATQRQRAGTCLQAAAFPKHTSRSSLAAMQLRRR